MTEAEWNSCTDPQKLLGFLKGKASDRKLRLFAVACCRRIWTSLKQEPFRKVVRIAELFADGQTTKEEMAEARAAALPLVVQLSGGKDLAPRAAISAARIPVPRTSYLHQLLDAIDDPCWEDEFDKGDPHAPATVTARYAARAAAHEKGQVAFSDAPAEIAEKKEQAVILRDIFRNSVRPSSLDSQCLTSVVTQLAEAIYQNRAFDGLPILADVLEEAGCQNAEILGHLRSFRPHVRGCWCLDLIRGKS